MSIDRRFLDISLTVQGIANTPAENPAAGDQYIVGAEGSGAFAEALPNSIARFDGENWKFSAPRAGFMEALDASNDTILRYDGTDWVVVAEFNSLIAPVLDILQSGSTLPATCAAGETFLNTADNKLYSAESEDVWDSGTSITANSRYASATDFKIYESDGENLVGSDISDGGMFLNKSDNCIYVYDAAAHAFKRNGADVSVTEIHTLTAEELTAKSFHLNNSIAAGREGQVVVFIGGVSQVVGIDFTASTNTISWTGKVLDTVGLVAGDVFVVQYIKA